VIDIAFLCCITDFQKTANIIESVVFISVLTVPFIINYGTRNSPLAKKYSIWLRSSLGEPKAQLPRKIQFSLARMLLATAVVAIVFSVFGTLFSYKELATILLATLLALALGGLVLIGRKNELKIIGIALLLYIGTTVILGVVVTMIFWICSKMR
jgi:hypothetical protein